MPHKDPEMRKAYLKEYAKKNPAYARVKEWRKQNPDKVAEQGKRYVLQHPDKVKEKTDRWREKNLEHVRLRDRNNAARRRAAKPELVKLEKKAYAKRRNNVVSAAVARRKAAKLKRTPAWLTEFDKLKIECIYSIAAMLTRVNNEPWHVDHIVPLQGKVVSGLHVPSNLRVLRGVDNIRKHNLFEVGDV